MRARIKQLLSPPVFDDEERGRLARSAHIIALTSLMALFAAAVILLIVHRPIIAYLLLAGAGLMVIAFWLTRRGRLQSAMTLILLSILGIVTGVVYAGQGMHDVGTVVYPVVIIMASLLLKRRGVVLIAVLSILSVGFVTLGELNGLVRMALPGATGWDDFAGMAAILIVTAIVGWIMADDVLRSLARARHELTARARAEDALRVSEARYRQAIEAAGAVPYYQDYRADAYTFVGEGIRDLIGYAPDELTPTTWDSITEEIVFLGEVAGLPKEEAIRRARAGEFKTWKCDMRVRTRDGKIRWLADSSIEVLDERGVSHGSVGILQDITDRKQADEALRASEQKYRDFVEQSAEGIWLLEYDQPIAIDLPAEEQVRQMRQHGYVAECNSVFAKMYGYSTPNEMLGKRTSDFYGGEPDPKNDQATLALVKAGYRSNDRESREVNSRGEPAYFMNNAVGIIKDGNLVGLWGTQRDVTSLKQAEMALAHERDLLQALMDNIPDTIYFKDTASRFTRINQAQARLLGIPTPDAALGKTDFDFQSGELSKMFFEEEQQLLKTGQPVLDRIEYNPTPAGQPRWLSATKAPIRDAAGQIIGLVGVSRDITDRMLAEEREKTISHGLHAVIEVTHELIGCADLDTLCRRAVELAREKIGLERCGLFVLDAARETMLGMYGTDDRGCTTDERLNKLPAQSHPELFAPPDKLWSVKEDQHRYWVGAEPHIVGRGWLASTVIRSIAQPIGVLYNDTAISHAPLNEAQQDVVAVYCSLLGSLIELKRAEDAQRQSEAYLRAMFDNFPYWLWLKDAAGRFLAVNKTMTRSHGYDSVDAYIGKTDRDISPVELAEKYRADDQTVMANRTPMFMEETVIENGVEKWFETFKSPIFDAQENVIGTAGFAHDITERRQAESAIRESEALFRQLAENAPALIAIVNEQGLPTYLNRAWQEFRGGLPPLAIEEWSKQVHPDDREQYLRELQSALRTARKCTLEYRLLHADGQYRWLLDTVVPRYTADERLAGSIGIAIDITDRKQAEESLQRNEARLRLIHDNMVDTISQIDAQQRVLYVSPSVERVLGLRPGDIVGRSLLDFVHPDDSNQVFYRLLMAIELRAPSIRLAYRYQHADGHYVWVESEVRLLYDEHGQLTSAVFGSRDISVRKRIEQEQENLIKELESKNAELERFTYTVSHDLKSPLITIRGFLGFLEKDAVSGNFERLKADIARIAEATNQMQRLLNELLELSRVGRIVNPPQSVPFDAIAREAVELMQGRILARGVQVQIADSMPMVHGDRARLVEVMQNLIDNAVKFMGDQPEPHITIGAWGADKAGMPIFFVQDNGIGIDPQYHEQIFGLFNKLDAQTEGTGIGLALARRIVEVHGGRIWVESEPGRGSTFYFNIPINNKASPATNLIDSDRAV